MKVVYEITCPNGKIYVGSDRTDSGRTYFGSPSAEPLAAGFDLAELQDLTVRKQVLWQSGTADTGEVLREEIRLILEHRSNDPRIGYNRRPKFREEVGGREAG